MEERDFNIDGKLISKAEKEYEDELMRTKTTEGIAKSSVDCRVVPTGVVYAPNSIWHGASLKYMSKPTLLNIELERMRDFVDFLFNSKEYIDWCGQDEAWEDFEKHEAENQ